MDQMEEMWAETAAVNQNYFWSMLFFLGWVLYLLNGLVWAGFERSRAALILLTARKEATGSNARASRFDPSPSFLHDDGHSIHSEQSSIGNFLRSTMSRDWSRGQHPHQQEAAQMRKDAVNALRDAHADACGPAQANSRVPTRVPIKPTVKPRPSHLSTHSQHSTQSQHSTHSRLTTPSVSSRTPQHHHSLQHRDDGHQHHRTSWQKTERAFKHKLCPCLFETDEWRNCFPMTAPEFPLRTFQAVLLFFSLFLSLCLLVFYHIDPTFFTVVQSFFYLFMFGLNQLPFYATLSLGPLWPSLHSSTTSFTSPRSCSSKSAVITPTRRLFTKLTRASIHVPPPFYPTRLEPG